MLATIVQRQGVSSGGDAVHHFQFGLRGRARYSYLPRESRPVTEHTRHVSDAPVYRAEM